MDDTGISRAKEDDIMPYVFNEGLPISVRWNLPEHAQDIFRVASCNESPQQHSAGNGGAHGSTDMPVWGPLLRMLVHPHGPMPKPNCESRT